jgi:hypothetical protein
LYGALRPILHGRKGEAYGEMTMWTGLTREKVIEIAERYDVARGIAFMRAQKHPGDKAKLLETKSRDGRPGAAASRGVVRRDRRPFPVDVLWS